MTVKELQEMLSRHPESATILFAPHDFCSSGYPEWTRCSTHEQDTEADEKEIVEISLQGECE